MDHNPPGSSVHGILRARILEWVAIPFSRGSSWTQSLNLDLRNCRQILYHWATREALAFCLKLFCGFWPPLCGLQDPQDLALASTAVSVVSLEQVLPSLALVLLWEAPPRGDGWLSLILDDQAQMLPPSKDILEHPIWGGLLQFLFTSSLLFFLFIVILMNMTCLSFYLSWSPPLRL